MDCFDQLKQIQNEIDDTCSMIFEIINGFNHSTLGWPLDYIAEDVELSLEKYEGHISTDYSQPKQTMLQFRIQNLDENMAKEGHPIVINGINYQLVMDAKACNKAFQELHGHLIDVLKKMSNEKSTQLTRANYLNALNLDLEVFRNVQHILMLKMEYRGKDLKAMPYHEKIELLKLAGAKGI